MENKLPKIWLLVILMVLSYIAPVSGATFTAVKDGNWDDASVWGGAGVPGITDVADLNGYEVHIPSGMGAEVWKIDLTNVSSWLVMEGNTWLYFNGSTAGNGFIGVTQGDIECSGGPGSPVNISVKGGTQDWEFDGNNANDWNAEYTTIERADGGGDFRIMGKIEWNRVNITKHSGYAFFYGLDDNSFMRNVYMDGLSSDFYIYSIRGDLGIDVEVTNLTSENGGFFRDLFEMEFTNVRTNNGPFTHYQSWAENFTLRNYVTPYNGDALKLSNYQDCRGNYYILNASIVGKIDIRDNYHETNPYKVYINNSNFDGGFADNNQANISMIWNHSFIVFTHYQRTLNDWRYYGGHFASDKSLANYTEIDLDYRIKKADNVVIEQDFLYATEDINMQSLNVTDNHNIPPYYAQGYEVQYGTTTTGIYAYNITGDLWITNGSFMNFTYSDWGDSRADFYNASNISLVDWTTLPGGITGYAVNVTNTTETINFSLRLYDSANSNLKRWNGATWVAVPSTYNGVYHEANGLTVPGLYATDWTPNSNITGVNNTKYPYSINIKYNFSTDFATSCWFTYDKGRTNTSFPCSIGTIQFDVPFDTTYVLEVYSENAGIIDVDKLTFEVDRNMQGGIIWSSIIGVFGAIASFFLFAGISMDKKHMPLQMFFLGTSFWMGVNTLHAGVLGAREYLKTPLTTDTLMMVYNIGFWIFFAVFTVIILTVLYNSLIAIKEGKNDL